MGQAVRRGLAGIGAGLESFSTQMLRQSETRKGEQRREGLALLKDAEEKVATGTWEPEQANAMVKAHGIPVPEGYFDRIQAPVRSQVARAVDPIQKATSFEQLPTVEGLNATLSPRVGQITTSNIPEQFRDPTQTEAGLDQLSPQAGTIADALQAKRRSLVAATAPTKGDTVYDVPTGANYREPDRRYNAMTQSFDTMGDRVQMTPTPEESGYNKASEESTSLRAGAMQGIPTLRGQAAATTATTTKQLENVLGLPGMEADADNTKSDLTRSTRAKDAAAITTATSKASMPYQEAMAKYAHELQQGDMQIVTMNNPVDGTDEPVLMNKKGDMIRLDIPEGLSYGKTRQIPATIADNTAGMNAAEIEGVKILRALRMEGLDKSTDALDPRMMKFLVNVLKVAPEDLAKGDIQQRIGFVNATLTRALMGSRPSEYVAKNIIQPHLPQQEMTGQQLYRVLNNVLQQTGSRRQEFAHTLGLPLERLAPKDVNSYANYLKEAGTATNAPAQMTLDAQGNLVPVKR